MVKKTKPNLLNPMIANTVYHRCERLVFSEGIPRARISRGAFLFTKKPQYSWIFGIYRGDKHAEIKAMERAKKRMGSIRGGTLYTLLGAPCSDCLILLANNGVKTIVTKKMKYRDDFSKDIIEHFKINTLFFNGKKYRKF